jgi:hypothetical protein
MSKPHAQRNSSTDQADPVSHATLLSTFPTTRSPHLAPQSAPTLTTILVHWSPSPKTPLNRAGISIIHTQGITTPSEKQRATPQRPSDCTVADHTHGALDLPHVSQTAVGPNELTLDVDGREGTNGTVRRDGGFGVAGYADGYRYHSTGFLGAVFLVRAVVVIC